MRKLVFCLSMLLMLFVLITGQVFGQTAPLPDMTQVESLPVADSSACSGQFAPHDLDHITTVEGGSRVRQFEANGGGVAINDLDNDGDLDIVLANQAAPNTILWNEGNLMFRTEHLAPGDARAVLIIDLDGDGWQDILFSRTKSGVTYWHNQGDGKFEREILDGVGKPMYAIGIADMDGDNDLDLVGATYDASLLADYGTEFLSSGNSGVFYYENMGGVFRLHVLATRAQALALALVDVNQDGHLDILVGNDFDLPDGAWLWTASGFQAAAPFTTTSHSTMSLDFADLNNDGQTEVFSTDMRPYSDDAQSDAEWSPILPGLIDRPQNGDPQVNYNVLNAMGSGADSAQQAGIAATGWSWSGKFGDLDQDGWLDLYVVNGFIEAGTFAHLPGGELVEANQSFRNTGDGQFALMPEWGLGSLRSGRGMSMADLDGDGDLDIVVNNLLTPAELFENQLCQGSSLQVELNWPGRGNSRAIGATLVLHAQNATYYRDVRAGSGYLSGDAARIHFGFPAAETPRTLEIRWPDGLVSSLTVPPDSRLVRVTRAG